MSAERSPNRLLIFAATAGLGLLAFNYFTPSTNNRPAATANSVQPAEAASARPQPASVTAASAPDESLRRTGTLEVNGLDVEVDNIGAGLTHARLLGRQFRIAGRPIDLVTTSRDAYRPLRIDLAGSDIPNNAVWDLEQVSSREVKLTLETERVRVVRTLTAGPGPYQILQRVQVQNRVNWPLEVRLSAQTFHYVRRSEESSGWFGARPWPISQGLCRNPDETVRKDRTALAVRHGYRRAAFTGIENTYFANVVAPRGEQGGTVVCGLHATDWARNGEQIASLFEARLLMPPATIAVGGEQTWDMLAYVGPKDWDSLNAAGGQLEEVVNLGTFSWIARQFSVLLSWIHSGVGNWGVAIILLTVLVRLLLYPLMARNFKMMAQLRPLKPELDRINQLYAGEMEKRSAAVMELYRKHGINPYAQLWGCLPLLAQMPIFISLYASLSANVELFHAPFALWWTDLSAPDRFFVLPLLISALMFVQQKMTPTTADPAQAKIMLYMMPIMMGGFSLFLPAGLGLYWVTGSLLSLVQQRWNEYQISKITPAVPADVAAPKTKNEKLST